MIYVNIVDYIKVKVKKDSSMIYVSTVDYIKVKVNKG